MKPANDKGPTNDILTDGVDVESVAQRVGITEDQVRNICYKYAEEILQRMSSSAEEAIRELAYDEGLLSLEEPEIPEEVARALARFTGHQSVAVLEAYEDRPPASIYLVDDEK